MSEPAQQASQSADSDEEEFNRIPMADEQEEEDEDVSNQQQECSPTPAAGNNGPDSLTVLDDEDDLNGEEQEEKARLIAQVLELQNTLDDLSSRVDNVKEENLRLRSENQVLGQYIENLMAASSVFQPANGDPSPSTSHTRGKKK